jgi:hypothetical protein
MEDGHEMNHVFEFEAKRFRMTYILLLLTFFLIALYSIKARGSSESLLVSVSSLILIHVIQGLSIRRFVLRCLGREAAKRASLKYVVLIAFFDIGFLVYPAMLTSDCRRAHEGGRAK